MTILLNDQFLSRDDVHIDLEDRGYQFGDGIYEVVRIYNGVPFELDPHLVRFQRSADEIGLKLPMSLEETSSKITQLIELNKLKDGIIYFQVTRGAAPRNHAYPANTTAVLTAYTKEVPRPVEKLEKGIKVVTIEDIRWLRCDIKSLNLLGNVMAKQYAVDHGADEAVQIRDNIVTEGSSSNFYIVKDGKIFTHPANNFILNGITRMVIKDIANKLNIPFIEENFTFKEVLEADEAFISSTTVEAMPVIQINDHVVNHEPGPIVRALQAEIEKRIIK